MEEDIGSPFIPSSQGNGFFDNFMATPVFSQEGGLAFLNNERVPSGGLLDLTLQQGEEVVGSENGEILALDLTPALATQAGQDASQGMEGVMDYGIVDEFLNLPASQPQVPPPSQVVPEPEQVQLIEQVNPVATQELQNEITVQLLKQMFKTFVAGSVRQAIHECQQIVSTYTFFYDTLRQNFNGVYIPATLTPPTAFPPFANLITLNYSVTFSKTLSKTFLIPEFSSTKGTLQEYLQAINYDAMAVQLIPTSLINQNANGIFPMDGISVYSTLRDMISVLFLNPELLLALDPTDKKQTRLLYWPSSNDGVVNGSASLQALVRYLNEATRDSRGVYFWSRWRIRRIRFNHSYTQVLNMTNFAQISVTLEIPQTISSTARFYNTLGDSRQFSLCFRTRELLDFTTNPNSLLATFRRQGYGNNTAPPPFIFIDD